MYHLPMDMGYLKVIHRRGCFSHLTPYGGGFIAIHLSSSSLVVGPATTHSCQNGASLWHQGGHSNQSRVSNSLLLLSAIRGRLRGNIEVFFSPDGVEVEDKLDHVKLAKHVMSRNGGSTCADIQPT